VDEYSRTVVLFATILLAVGLSAGAVGVAAGEHDEQTDEYDVIEVRTVTAEGTDTGELHAVYSYHIGEKTRELTVSVLSGEQPTSTDGFEPTGDPNVYEWDEQTDDPTIEFSIDANRSDPRNDGLVSVDTGEWAMLGNDALPRTEIRPVALESDIDDIEIDWVTVAPDGEGIAGDGFVYLGGYDRYEFDNGVELVVSDHADPGSQADIEEMGRTLEQLSEQLTAGNEGDVTAFVVTSPLRLGGLSVGSDFWIHDETLPPETVLHHEFAHTQQQYRPTDAVAWTIEGSAEYYGSVLALTQGDIQYHEFRERLNRGSEYDDVVLADRSSWVGTDGDYEQGALVLAALDGLIRENSENTFADVLQSKNGYDGKISTDRFEAFASTAAGRDLGDFFDEYVRSTPPEIDAPSPVVYDGSMDGAAPAIRLGDVEFDPSGETEIPLTIANGGSETSLAPRLAAESPATVELVSAEGTVSEIEGGWVFEHVEPGETRTATLTVDAATPEEATVDLSVEDMSEQGDSTIVSFDELPAVEATLAGPATAEAGKPIELVADSNIEADRIEQYEFTVGEEQTTSTDRTVEYTFGSAGEYNLSVSVVTVDGRTGTASTSISVTEREGFGQSTTNDETDTAPGDESPSADDTQAGDDAIGPGFGVGVAVTVVVFLGLLASRAGEKHT
jgi:chitodextrinase